MNRTLLGLIAAPLVPAVIALLYALHKTSSIYELIWLFASCLIAGYFFALILGLPSYYVMNKKGYRSVVSYMVLGVIIGIIVAAPFVTTKIYNFLNMVRITFHLRVLFHFFLYFQFMVWWRQYHFGI